MTKLDCPANAMLRPAPLAVAPTEKVALNDDVFLKRNMTDRCF